MKKYAKFVVIGLLSSVLLTACGTDLSDKSADITKVNLPIVQEYDEEIQDAAAQEMALQHCPVLNKFTVDYGIMRDETRVLLGETVDVNR
jgi:hypothetical protein